jgi:hypothetical protein
VAAWLKLAGKIVRITSSTDEVDHLSAKLRRIRWTCSWHRQHLWRETQGVHQTGSIPVKCSKEDTTAAFKIVGHEGTTLELEVQRGFDQFGRHFEQLLGEGEKGKLVIVQDPGGAEYELLTGLTPMVREIEVRLAAGTTVADV